MTAELLRVLSQATVASSAAILLVLLLRRPMRRTFGAAASYALWTLVPLAVFASVLPAPAQTLSMPMMPLMLPAMIPAATSAAVSAAPQMDITLLLTFGWIVGFGCAVFAFMREQRRFVRALGRLTPAEMQTARAQTSAGCPALVGAWNPQIVLPADFEQRYNVVERELILAHERTHCARGDAQINVLATALRCLFWFNPLVHFAASRFRFDQELACDASVISRFPEARRPYADAMLKTQLADLGLPAGCHWQSSHPLKERINMLKRPIPGRVRAVLGAACALTMISGGSFAAWAAQPAAASSDKAPGDTNAGYRKLSRIAYPPAALAAKSEGVVYVKVHVGADGKPTSTGVAQIGATPDKVLAEAAVSGVQTWTFDPAKKQGKAIESDEIVPIVFFLNPDAISKTSGGTLEAIRVGPPEAKASSANNAPATEDVSFRKADPPRYPQAAIDAHQQGEIVLKVGVAANGEPTSAEVFEAKPPEAKEIFGASSVEAVMKWKFNPAVQNGKAFASYVFVPFTYSLRD